YNTHSYPHIFTLSLHDALPIYRGFKREITGEEASRAEADPDSKGDRNSKPENEIYLLLSCSLFAKQERLEFLRTAEDAGSRGSQDRKSTRLNSSHVAISYAVFC